MNATTPADCLQTALPRVDEAIALVRGRIVPIAETEIILLYRATGRVLAHDARASATVPPCNRSAMDGYAFRSGGRTPLRVIGCSVAGRPFQGVVADGECIAIATGGTVPDDCDTVAMRERCRQTLDGLFAEAIPGTNVRHRGEDFQHGEILARTGTRLDARHLALLAAGGITAVTAFRRLRVAILSIGDELAADAPDHIHDANRAMLAGFCETLGANVTDLGILSDNRDRIAQTLAEAAASHDAIISSASTSVGDEDHARGAVLDCGGIPLLGGVAIKPGKPIAFSLVGQCLHIALPGNPAAAFVTFAVIGAPLLRHLAGAQAGDSPWRQVRAGFACRKKPGLREYVRVRLRSGADGIVEAVRSGDDGSAMLSSLAASDGLVCLPEDATESVEGVLVTYCAFGELTAP